MATYIGFSTINLHAPRANPESGIDGGPGSITSPIRYGKKFRLTDEELVVQDFINALNISQGQKVGNPAYGTTLWSFVFEPNTADTHYQIETEMRRVASIDTRLSINSINVFYREHGILIETELAIEPFNNAQTINIFFNNVTNAASVATTQNSGFF